MSNKKTLRKKKPMSNGRLRFNVRCHERKDFGNNISRYKTGKNPLDVMIDSEYESMIIINLQSEMEKSEKT